jgi:hypothetical protein
MRRKLHLAPVSGRVAQRHSGCRRGQLLRDGAARLHAVAGTSVFRFLQGRIAAPRFRLGAATARFGSGSGRYRMDRQWAAKHGADIEKECNRKEQRRKNGRCVLARRDGQRHARDSSDMTRAMQSGRNKPYYCFARHCTTRRPDEGSEITSPSFVRGSFLDARFVSCFGRRLDESRSTGLLVVIDHHGFLFIEVDVCLLHALNGFQGLLHGSPAAVSHHAGNGQGDGSIACERGWNADAERKERNQKLSEIFHKRALSPMYPDR